MPEASPFAGPELAARVEAAHAAELASFAETAARLYPDCGAETLRVAGGNALFAGEGSPVNQAIGLGMAGEVTTGEIDRLVEFYRWHHTPPVVVACPLAHPTLLRLLSAHDFVAMGFENALARPLVPGERLPAPDPAIEVRRVDADARELYARMVVEGFAPVGTRPSPAEVRLGRVSAHRDAMLFLAFVDGEAAGTGELVVRDGVALLTGDTTLPPFRRRGVQRSLQLARLALARDAGCELAATDARPGSASQRNMERVGFSMAYTRLELALPTVTAGTAG